MSKTERCYAKDKGRACDCFLEGEAKGRDEVSWHKFDAELQKKIYLEVKRWKEQGRKWSGTYWTDCIFRTIGNLLELERAEEQKRILEILNRERNYFSKPETEMNKSLRFYIEDLIAKIKEEK